MAQGFVAVPGLLLQAQRDLGITALQLAVLVQILGFWWINDRHPFPSKATIAWRLKISERHVQRQIAGLEQAGLIKRIDRRDAHHAKATNAYDLSGLVRRLRDMSSKSKKDPGTSDRRLRRDGNKWLWPRRAEVPHSEVRLDPAAAV